MAFRSRKARLRFLMIAAFMFGALSTIGAAWSSALMLDFDNSSTEYRGSGLSSAEWWHVSRKDVFGGARYTSTVMVRALQYEPTDQLLALPEWAHLDPPPTLGSPYRNDHYEIIEARGWPWLALSYQFMGNGRAQVRTGDVTGGIALKPWNTAAWYSPRVLPYTPVWSGLLGNLAVYTIAWFVFLAVIIEGRRAWRRRRSLCEECAYPFGASDVCTECGTAIRSRHSVKNASDT